MKSLLNTFASKPYLIFLADGIGAFLTAAFLLLLIAPWESLFGMPRQLVYLLGSIALLLMCSSLACYLIKPVNRKQYLKLIIAANIAYTCITATLLLIYFQQITTWGFLYFLPELIIMICLIYLELQVHAME